MQDDMILPNYYEPKTPFPLTLPRALGIFLFDNPSLKRTAPLPSYACICTALFGTYFSAGRVNATSSDAQRAGCV